MGNCSNRSFPNACKNGDLATVQETLSNLESHEICILGNDNTTALHKAVANGQKQIVAALIVRCCSRTVKDKRNRTAYEYAPNRDIQLMLRRSSNTSRFEQKPRFFVERAFSMWRYIVNPFRIVECTYNEREGLEERRAFVLLWIQTTLVNPDERHLIKNYFDTAFALDSTAPIFKAFTEETAFYLKINEGLLQESETRVFQEGELHGALLISRNLFKGTYDGKHGANYNHPLYAKTMLDNDEIEWYKTKVGAQPLSLKIFWSLTKERQIAETMNGNVLFIINCKEQTTKRTISLEELSGYPYEREVLMAPMTKIQIISVEQKSKHGYEIRILFWDW